MGRSLLDSSVLEYVLIHKALFVLQNIIDTNLGALGIYLLKAMGEDNITNNREVHDANALKSWNKVVAERRKLYGRLKKKIHRPADQMVMNSSYACYSKRTENEMIDQALPCLSYGKGVKYCDDYWFESSNPALPADSTVRPAKTVRDKGQFPPLEYIGVPNLLRYETDGFQESEKTTLKCPMMHKKWFKKHPWHIIKPFSSTKAKYTYKTERMKMIDPLVSKLLPHRPDVRELAVIGNYRSLNDLQNSPAKSASPEICAITSETSVVGDTITELSITPREVEDQAVDEEFGGASLLFNGILVPHLVRGRTNSYKIVSDQFTLCFRTSDENPGHQRILIKNNGTEDLAYQWKKVERKVFLEILPPRGSPFYFFTNSGRIVCGETKELWFSFQSSYEGVFSETWHFTTDPPLLPTAAPIALHLFGIQRQITKEFINEVVKDCVASIYWTGTKKPSIIDAQTEADLCAKQNPDINLSFEAVNALIALRNKALISTFGSTTWDYSLDTLRQEIIDMHTEGHIKPADADTLLQQLYRIVDDLSFPPMVVAPSSAEVQYRLCASVVRDCLLKAFEACSDLRNQMGMDPLPRMPDVIQPWRQKVNIRECTRNSNQLQLISKERDSIPQVLSASLREQIGDVLAISVGGTYEIACGSCEVL
ncbi:hypothetical protein TcWFU_007325 [Taenia crassiceps]|uniref:MYCBP-associated protein n=1 Tax=Taenia crassiceps TaxID=6207 RepID=A0ABR4Q4D6_9CEST